MNPILVITAAGRAAMVAANNMGTLPVVVSHIGVTAQAFAANKLMTALPGEIKRLTTFGGMSVADDTIHVTIRDDSNGVYSVRGFAAYLANGTLFALYGQADVIGEKSAQSTLLLAIDAIFDDIDVADITFGPTEWSNPPATADTLGVMKYATNVQAAEGVALRLGVAPEALKYALDQRFGVGAPSAFVKSLLNLATAALLRSSLEIKSAALKNEGAGNGLDADKLDGQQGAFYLDFANMQNVPAFAPVNHTHTISQVADLANQLAAKSEKNVTLTRVGLIAPGVDLNTLVTIGIYHQNANANATLANNYPIANAAGMLQVYADLQMVYQSYQNYATGARYHRSSYNNSWSDWRASWDSLNFDPATKAAANHVHATLTFGNYIDGVSYNGSTAMTISLVADTLPTPLKLVARDVSGDVQARLFRSTYTVMNPTIAAIMTMVDPGETANNFIRPSTPAQVKAALAIVLGDVGGLAAALAALAPKANATFTGTMNVPTPAAADDSTKGASTAWVRDYVASVLASYLPKNNPTFTGTMTGPSYNET